MVGSFGFGRLVRFENDLGQVKYGEVASDRVTSLEGSNVEVFNGDVPWGPGFAKSGKTDVVRKVGHNA